MVGAFERSAIQYVSIITRVALTSVSLLCKYGLSIECYSFCLNYQRVN